MNQQERIAWDRAQIVLASLMPKKSIAKADIARFLGVHHNTIHKDELLLLAWCEPYQKAVQLTPLLPLSKGGRPRLNHYCAWLLLLCRFLVVFSNRTEAAKFFLSIDNQNLISEQNFQHIKNGARSHATGNKVRRIFAA
jgi:hypothetical protein